MCENMELDFSAVDRLSRCDENGEHLYLLKILGTF